MPAWWMDCDSSCIGDRDNVLVPAPIRIELYDAPAALLAHIGRRTHDHESRGITGPRLRSAGVSDSRPVRFALAAQTPHWDTVARVVPATSGRGPKNASHSSRRSTV